MTEEGPRPGVPATPHQATNTREACPSKLCQPEAKRSPAGKNWTGPYSISTPSSVPGAGFAPDRAACVPGLEGRISRLMSCPAPVWVPHWPRRPSPCMRQLHAACSKMWCDWDWDGVSFLSLVRLGASSRAGIKERGGQQPSSILTHPAAGRAPVENLRWTDADGRDGASRVDDAHWGSDGDGPSRRVVYLCSLSRRAHQVPSLC